MALRKPSHRHLDRHADRITDPLARQWWIEYRHVIATGNPLGLSFVEYIAHRVNALGPRPVYTDNTAFVPWYVAGCGHAHPWGVPCSDPLTVVQ